MCSECSGFIKILMKCDINIFSATKLCALQQKQSDDNMGKQRVCGYTARPTKTFITRIASHVGIELVDGHHFS